VLCSLANRQKGHLTKRVKTMVATSITPLDGSPSTNTSPIQPKPFPDPFPHP
jgi:hypothetical protein